jgi:hypothetical protein
VVLDELCLVEDQPPELEPLELVEVQTEQRVGHHDDVAVSQLVGKSGSALRARLLDRDYPK